MISAANHKQSPNYIANALTKAQVCEIASEHAEFFSALIDTSPTYTMTQHDMAIVGARVLLEQPEIVTSILANGLRCTRLEAAEISSFRRLLLVKDVADLTGAAHRDGQLWPAVRTILADYSQALAGTCH